MQLHLKRVLKNTNSWQYVYLMKYFRTFIPPGLGYVEETLEELSSSNLLVKRKRPKLEISTGKSALDDLEAVSRESSPDHEMSPDLAVSRCLICSRYITMHPYSSLSRCLQEQGMILRGYRIYIYTSQFTICVDKLHLHCLFQVFGTSFEQGVKNL